MTPDSSLTDGEHLVLRVHPHWKILIRPVSVALLVVVAALVAEVMIPSGSAAALARLVVAAVAILAVMLWLMVPVLRWRTTTYELTTRRLRMRDGIVTRHGRDIPLARINDVSFTKGLRPAVRQSGRLVVESALRARQILLNDIRGSSSPLPRCSACRRSSAGWSGATGTSPDPASEPS
jgi:membrane protein YdbS with pleckstrin-like domain